MSLNHPVIHEGYVPAYQASAIPWVTSSQISTGEVHEYSFPQVTRFFNIQNLGTNAGDILAIAFTERGLDPNVGNFFTIGQGVSFREEIRTTKLFVSFSAGTSPFSYQIVAGLTNISPNQFLTITGSNGHQGVG